MSQEALEAFQTASERARAAGKLLYTPPTQVEPQTIEIPAGTTFSSTTVAPAGRDAIIKLPASARKRGLVVEQAGHLRVIGGEINGTGGTLTETWLRAGNNAKSFYVEGVLLNGAESSKDLIDISGTSGTGPFLLSPDMYIQKTRGEKIHGTSAGEHADLFQAQGSMGNFYCWLYTGYTQYQGLFLNPAKPMGNIFIDYTNIGYEEGGDSTTFALWFLEKVGEVSKAATRDVYLGKNVYVAPKGEQSLGHTCWPPPGQLDTNGARVGAEEFEVEGVKALKWPPAARIHGYVKEGLPGGGDFVTKAAVGLDLLEHLQHFFGFSRFFVHSSDLSRSAVLEEFQERRPPHRNLRWKSIDSTAAPSSVSLNVHLKSSRKPVEYGSLSSFSSGPQTLMWTLPGSWLDTLICTLPRPSGSSTSVRPS